MAACSPAWAWAKARRRPRQVASHTRVAQILHCRQATEHQDVADEGEPEGEAKHPASQRGDLARHGGLRHWMGVGVGAVPASISFCTTRLLLLAAQCCFSVPIKGRQQQEAKGQVRADRQPLAARVGAALRSANRRSSSHQAYHCSMLCYRTSFGVEPFGCRELPVALTCERRRWMELCVKLNLMPGRDKGMWVQNDASRARQRAPAPAARLHTHPC